MTVKILMRLAAFGAAFYGAWIWIFSSFDHASAFSWYAGAPEYPFSLLLIAGGALIEVGLWREQPGLKFIGLLMCLIVFLAADLSCCARALRSTGVPIYSQTIGFYGVLIVCAGLKAKPPSDVST